jgi:hypothetical protein
MRVHPSIHPSIDKNLIIISAHHELPPMNELPMKNAWFATVCPRLVDQHAVRSSCSTVSFVRLCDMLRLLQKKSHLSASPWRILGAGFSSSGDRWGKPPGLFGTLSDANKEWLNKVSPAVAPSKTTLTAGIVGAILASPFTAPYVKAAGQYVAAIAGQPTNQLIHSLRQHLLPTSTSNSNSATPALTPGNNDDVKKLSSMTAVEFLQQLQTIVEQQPEDKTCRQLAQELATFCKQQTSSSSSSSTPPSSTPSSTPNKNSSSS